MINFWDIKPNTPVVCSLNTPLAVVEEMENSQTIKLAADSEGYHHYIPMSWVTKVDDKVHIDRPYGRAMREWSTRPRSVASATS